MSVFTYGPSLLFFDSLKVCVIVSKRRICTSQLHELVSIDHYRCCSLSYLTCCLFGSFSKLAVIPMTVKISKCKDCFWYTISLLQSSCRKIGTPGFPKICKLDILDDPMKFLIFYLHVPVVQVETTAMFPRHR